MSPIENALLELLRQAVRQEVEPLRARLDAMTEERAASIEYLTTSQAAKIVGVHPDTMRSLVAASKLPRREVAGHLRFVRADLDKLLGAGAGDASDDAETIAERMIRTA